MGKKNRHHKQVLKSFQELGRKPGEGANATLSRLATTVKADAATLMLQTPKKAGSPESGKMGGQTMSHAMKSLSNFGQKLLPNRILGRKGKGVFSSSVLSTNKKLQKLAKQMAMRPSTVMSGPPKSRLPYFIASLTVVLAAACYYTYQNVSLPDLEMNVSQYVDFSKWLDLAAGKQPKSAPNHEKSKSIAITDHATPQQRVLSNPSFNAPSKGSPSAVVSPVIPKSIVYIPTKPVPTKADKIFAKLPKQKKKQIWHKRLAVLKQTRAESPIKPASYKKAPSGKHHGLKATKAHQKQAIKKSMSKKKSSKPDKLSQKKKAKRSLKG